jgi:hypothetical protein
MYGWLWRHIPVRQAKFKALISVIVVAAIGALLWYKVFPAVEPILPFDDGQIEGTDGQPANGDNVAPAGSSVPAPNATSTKPVVIPS